MRDRFAVLFALLAVVVAVGAVFGYFRYFRGGEDRQAQAEETAAAFAAAWEGGDWDDLADLTLAAGDVTASPEPGTAPPATAAASPDGASREGGAPEPVGAPGDDATAGDIAGFLEQSWSELEVTGTQVETGAVTLDRGRADTTFAVTLTLAGLGDWSYETDVVLLRETGQWRVDWSPAVVHPDLDEGEHFDRQVTDVTRAPILAHDGAPLTQVGEVVDVGIEPRRIEDEQRLVSAFEEHTNADPQEVRELLARDDLVPEWFYPVITLRQDEFEQVEGLLRPVPGVVFKRTEGRVAPSPQFARHLLGRTGEITAELLEELGDPYAVGDVVGRSGLERVFEEQLSGRPGAQIRLVPAGVEEPDDPHVVQAFQENAPEPVTTTLDLGVQEAVEAAIGGVDGPAAIVVVDPASGAIRGAASRPLDEFNRALAGQYPPGSTFKVVSTAAVLQQLGAEPAATCPAEVNIGGRRFTNAHDLALGEIALPEAFVRSCNTAFAQYAAELGDGDLDAAAAGFGFGTRYALALDVAGGSFPPPGDLAERAAAAIGQGRVQASPLHMASVAGAVAASTWRPPHLLADEVADGERDIDDAVSTRLADLMRRAVEGGTGTAAQVPGRSIAGKTGTAEFGEPDETGELASHAWFIGFTPADADAGFAFAVLVEGGGGGGEVAAPVAARLVEALPGASG